MSTCKFKTSWSKRDIVEIRMATAKISRNSICDICAYNNENKCSFTSACRVALDGISAWMERSRKHASHGVAELEYVRT